LETGLQCAKTKETFLRRIADLSAGRAAFQPPFARRFFVWGDSMSLFEKIRDDYLKYTTAAADAEKIRPKDFKIDFNIRRSNKVEIGTIIYKAGEEHFSVYANEQVTPYEIPIEAGPPLLNALTELFGNTGGES
jgi:hypothetical protein